MEYYLISLIAKIGFYLFATKVFWHHKACEKVIFSIKHQKKCSQICEYKEYIVSLPQNRKMYELHHLLIL